MSGGRGARATDGDAPLARTIPLGDLDPAGSRQMGRRSAVAVVDDRVVVGGADGRVRAFDYEADSLAWERRIEAGDDSDGVAPSIVSLVPLDGDIAVGTRGRDGAIALLDGDTGAVRWRYDAVADLGPPQDETRFLLPFVAALAVTDGTLYAAARRYERVDSGDRRFESRIYAFEGDGSIEWDYAADASPIGLATDADRLAVAYNRCPGDHDEGLVVLDRADGTEWWRWDPVGDGQRRVGEVAWCEGDVVAASHADYCGYRLSEGDVVWREPLGTEVEGESERLYAYPNHVHATDEAVVFVTGNTYAVDARETECRHPREHTAFGFAPDGERRWTAEVGGFAHGVGTDGDLVAVPAAQHFRERTPDAHALHLLDCHEGPVDAVDAEGVVTAADVSGETVAGVEEPVVYHDEGEERGAYRLHVLSETRGP